MLHLVHLAAAACVIVAAPSLDLVFRAIPPIAVVIAVVLVVAGGGPILGGSVTLFSILGAVIGLFGFLGLLRVVRRTFGRRR
jgi:ubiquinone biosynthesis protein